MTSFPIGKLLASSTLAVLLTVGAAHGQSMTKTTVVAPATAPAADVKVIDLAQFDRNGDKILSTPEIGEGLFYIYDGDGNQVLDNIEFEHSNFITLTPMTATTITQYDFDGDGIADSSTMSQDAFMRQSRLAVFDEDKDGLSPTDFIEQSFLETDINKSKVIELEEWKSAYIASLKKKVEEKYRYQN